ncbi:MAG: hypothetical protein CFH05_00330 [Alphaproteobacteria bacterium MarineAlpha3_Bin4]|nr:MAG: hypothetical protein CFH05_00330 [Alphaproteobacteria bacterium MarineAlpha3_Bin4]
MAPVQPVCASAFGRHWRQERDGDSFGAHAVPEIFVNDDLLGNYGALVCLDVLLGLACHSIAMVLMPANWERAALSSPIPASV